MVWPPLKLPQGARVAAAGAAKGSLLGSDRDPAGGRVVTYNKWPLYTYVGDKSAGQAKGQALNLNGGYWYVLSPSGKVIHTKHRRQHLQIEKRLGGLRSSLAPRYR